MKVTKLLTNGQRWSNRLLSIFIKEVSRVLASTEDQMHVVWVTER